MASSKMAKLFALASTMFCTAPGEDCNVMDKLMNRTVTTAEAVGPILNNLVDKKQDQVELVNKKNQKSAQKVREEQIKKLAITTPGKLMGPIIAVVKPKINEMLNERLQYYKNLALEQTHYDEMLLSLKAQAVAAAQEHVPLLQKLMKLLNKKDT